MAIYHLHVGIVSRKTGRDSTAAAAYRAGEKVYDERTGISHDYTNRNSVNAAAYRSGERLTTEQGKIFDFTNKKGVVHTEILLPENAPKYFLNRSTLWNAVEKAEKRYDAQTARDIDVALPIELSRQEQIETMREYIHENFVSKGMIADFAIHDKGDGNPHAHILLTTRDVNENGFGNKNRAWNNKKLLLEWRKNWADICNKKLLEKGLNERIDHRTLKAQGIDREPTIHIGVTAQNMQRKGIATDRVKENREIIESNRAKEALTPEKTAEYLHELKQGYTILDNEILALQQEIVKAQVDIRDFRKQAEDMDERTKYIHSLNEQLEKLKAERQGMGFFKSKKAIDGEIRKLEKQYEQAINSFNQAFKITPDQAAAEIEQLNGKIRSKGHFQEKLKEKTSLIVEEREGFKLEYQRQKLTLRFSPNSQKTDKILKQLEHETRKSQTIKNNITWQRNIRILEDVTEQNFQRIMETMHSEQAENLIKHRENAKKQELNKKLEYERYITQSL